VRWDEQQLAILEHGPLLIPRRLGASRDQRVELAGELADLGRDDRAICLRLPIGVVAEHIRNVRVVPVQLLERPRALGPDVGTIAVDLGRVGGEFG